MENFFALDIGTRSIMGILGNVEDDKVRINHVEVEFHKKRAMFDGQVHDIMAVSENVKKVKERLEEKSGQKLESVAIAAAGRALKTIKVQTSLKMEKDHTIDAKDIKEINVKGLEQATKELNETIENNTTFFNVGHTVMTYKVNDMEIKNPLGHKGDILHLEIIATFLPKTVIDALSAVIKNAGLEISFVSLEPIVAIEVAVPENVRLLNIAMVDVGAGTSDIAVTKDGLIIGYDMTSTAGDEMTEAISQKYLLDYDTAERVKCNLKNSDTQEFTDIVGIKQEIKTEQILSDISEEIKTVCKNIADAIKKANGKSPSAVFMIGGGCQVPGMNKEVAGFLELPENRVVIKDISMIPNVVCDNEILQGPESITPVGILVSSLKLKKNNFIEVYVNDKKIRLFRSTHLKVADALLSAGFNPKELIGKKGKSILIKVNETKKIYNGKYGEEAKIEVNGEKATIDTNISESDRVTIIPAKQGEDAKVEIEEALKDYVIYINDNTYPIYYDVKVNGEMAFSLDRILENSDEIEFDMISSLEDLIKLYELNEEDIYEINGEISPTTVMIKPNDRIKFIKKENFKQNFDNKVLKNFKKEHSITVNYNSKDIKIIKENDNFLFVDIFDYIDFDTTQVKGRLITKVNGVEVGYTDKIKDGDKIEIYWE